MNDESLSKPENATVPDEEAIQHYLAVPYVAVFSSTVNDDGEWVRRADYPELPNCEVEADTAMEAMDKLEERRVTTILQLLYEGKEPPVPRAPLGGGSAGLSSAPLATQLRWARGAPGPGEWPGSA